ncbi:hypothetical protein ACFV08_23460, partial [Streptomyces fradiae]|uniref:hypothetical protein n=1 Tax=Streptomyces fradiae TaxID=1906 RepID=UPI0036B4009E
MTNQPGAAVTVSVNGEPRELAAPVALDALVATLTAAPSGVGGGGPHTGVPPRAGGGPRGAPRPPRGGPYPRE